MTIALTILLIAFCIQGLVKLAVGFLVPMTPESPPPPRKLMSYPVQANPVLAWREIALMTCLFAWTLFALIRGLVAQH